MENSQIIRTALKHIQRGKPSKAVALFEGLLAKKVGAGIEKLKDNVLAEAVGFKKKAHAECESCSTELADDPRDRAENGLCSECNRYHQREYLKSFDEAINNYRPLSAIAREIRKDWKSVNYAAKPYLDAMGSLSKITDDHGQDSGRSVVSYFLSNASSWKGETAKRIKAELNAMAKGKAVTVLKEGEELRFHRLRSVPGTWEVEGKLQGVWRMVPGGGAFLNKADADDWNSRNNLKAGRVRKVPGTTPDGISWVNPYIKSKA